MPVTILLKAIGLNPEAILANFFVFDNFRLMDSGAQLEFVADRLRGEIARFDITDKNGNVIVEKDKRITARHVRADRAVGDQVHHRARGLPRRPHAGAQRRRCRHRRDPGQGQRRADRHAAEEAARGRRQGNPGALHQRARRRRLHLADARVRRDRRPARRARRHLPHDAARRAADRRRGRGAVPSPLLLGRHLRPVARRPDEVQRPRRPRRAGRRDDAVERGHPRRRQDPGRAAQRPRRGRRHRPPRQPPRALRRRAGREPVPLGPRPDREGRQGASRPGRDRSPDAARPDQLEADLGGAEGVLRRVAAEPVHGPDQPALRDHAQAARLGPGPGRPDPRARRLRSPRRAPDALRPRLPDRDAGRPEHRPDQLARPVRAAQRVRLPRDAVPSGRRRQGDERRSTTCRRSRKAST